MSRVWFHVASCMFAALWATADADSTTLGRTSSPSPLLGDGSAVDWWFAFKLNTKMWPECTTERKCIFGGEVQDYRNGYGLQYLLASSIGRKTSPLELHTDCLGSGDDPVAKTFAQVWDGVAPNYVIWNDQLYGDPLPNITPPCDTYSSHACDAPWGHSKGVLAWGDDGSGFVMQVSTPDWPGNGDKRQSRPTQGNTLGCMADDNAKVAQHFFALRLQGASDTQAILHALQRASVVTDPSNTQLVMLSQDGPSELAALARELGKVDPSKNPFRATLSGQSVELLAKPSALAVPPWQLVSSLSEQSLRCATWWATPKIYSTNSGVEPGCWDSVLPVPKEVQIATTGQWDGTVFSLRGSSSPNANHAKIGHSLNGTLSFFGDMNQEGSYWPSDEGGCTVHQGGRGGLFFMVDDATLHSNLQDLLQGDTAAYFGPDPSPKPPPPPPGPSPTPSGVCGGPGIRFRDCKERLAEGCWYVYARDARKCKVSKYGCYMKLDLPSSCSDKNLDIVV